MNHDWIGVECSREIDPLPQATISSHSSSNTHQDVILVIAFDLEICGASTGNPARMTSLTLT
jgi:hypothetical protein